MFDRKILLFIIVCLMGLNSLNFVVPNLSKVFGIEWLIFFVALAGMNILMHHLGCLEGFQEGFNKGLHEAEKPFIFLPHGSND